jgi:cysteine desulfurase
MMRNRLWERLRALVPGIALNGDAEQRVPNTLNVRFPRVSGPALLAATPEVAASTSAACRDGADVASAVILAMGVSHADALGSVRLSLGRSTTDADVDRAADALAAAWNKLRS